MGCSFGGDRNAELIEAVKNDELAKCWSSVEKGAEINCQDDAGQTPVYHAASHESTRCMEYLLQQGANVNIADEKGVTPAHIACAFNLLTNLQMLVEAGADLTLQDAQGQTVYDISSSDEINKYLDNLANQDEEDAKSTKQKPIEMSNSELLKKQHDNAVLMSRSSVEEMRSLHDKLSTPPAVAEQPEQMDGGGDDIPPDQSHGDEVQ